MLPSVHWCTIWPPGCRGFRSKFGTPVPFTQGVPMGEKPEMSDETTYGLYLDSLYIILLYTPYELTLVF